MPKPRILIAGGYGLVGGWIARHLRAAGHDIELVIGGRQPQAGAALAKELNASATRIDTTDAAASLAQAGPVDLVISALQDPDDALMIAALTTGAAHIGVVRKAETVGPTAIAAALLARRPALVLGHWQAGITTLAALDAARDFAQLERIDLAALFDFADPTGPMTNSDSGGFFTPALTRQAGHWVRLEPADSARIVARGGSLPSFQAQPMGALDVPSLVAATGAANVRFDLGVGQSIGTTAGGPASHEIYIDLQGRDAADAPLTRRTLVSDPKGQAHLTALGVLIGAERLLGLGGQPPLTGGLMFPEAVIDPARAMARLRAFGVNIETEPVG